MPLDLRPPTLSVVTCATHDGADLDRTIASVRQQDIELEHIIIGGPERIDSTVAHYSPGVGGGPYAAMNAGARVASGDLIAFLGAGDTYCSAASARTLVEIGSRYAWGYGRLCIFNERGAIRTHKFEPFSRRLLSMGVSYVPHPASVMRVSLLKELGGFDESHEVIADQDVFLRACRLHEPGVSRAVIAHFRSGGLSTRSSKEIAQDFEIIRRNVDGTMGRSTFFDRGVTLAVFAGRSSVRLGRRAIGRLG